VAQSLLRCHGRGHCRALVVLWLRVAVRQGPLLPGPCCAAAGCGERVGARSASGAFPPVLVAALVLERWLPLASSASGVGAAHGSGQQLVHLAVRFAVDWRLVLCLLCVVYLLRWRSLVMAAHLTLVAAVLAAAAVALHHSAPGLVPVLPPLDLRAVGLAALAALAALLVAAVVQRRRLGIGVEYVYLHYFYRPLFFSREVQTVHSYIDQRHQANLTVLETGVESPFAWMHVIFNSVGIGVTMLHTQVQDTIAAPFRAHVDGPEFFRSSGAAASSGSAVGFEDRCSRLLQSLQHYHRIDHSSVWWRWARWTHKLPLMVKRGEVFDSAAEQILAASHAQIFSGLNIVYVDRLTGEWERGIDAGGLTREFFTHVVSEVTDWAVDGRPANGSSDRVPKLIRQHSARGRGQAVFRALPDNSLMLQPSMRPPMFYIALGKVFGMAVIYSLQQAVAGTGATMTMPISLSAALLKFMVNTETSITAHDVRAMDPLFFKNRLEMMLQDGGVDLMKSVLFVDDMFFVADVSDCSGRDPSEEGCEVELKPGGGKQVVTEENKLEYVALMSEHYLCGDVRKEIGAFLRGFHELIPEHMLRMCGVSEKDLGLMITGIPTIDMKDWRDHTDVETDLEDPILPVDYWWAAVESLDHENRAKVLQFATGLSHLPAGGFRRLQPRFRLAIESHLDEEKLPTSHTCFNMVVLPPYTSIEACRKKLLIAVTEGAGGYELR